MQRGFSRLAGCFGTLLCLAAGCGSALRPVARKEDVRGDELLLVGRIRATRGGREAANASFRCESGPFFTTGPMGLVVRAGRRGDLPIRLETIRATSVTDEERDLAAASGVWIIEFGTRHSVDLVLAPMAAGTSDTVYFGTIVLNFDSGTVVRIDEAAETFAQVGWAHPSLVPDRYYDVRQQQTVTTPKVLRTGEAHCATHADCPKNQYCDPARRRCATP